MPPAVEVQSPNHWTAREFPDFHFNDGENMTRREEMEAWSKTEPKTYVSRLPTQASYATPYLCRRLSLWESSS